MDWNKIAEYLRESGFFTPEANFTVCEGIYIEDGNYYLSIFNPNSCNTLIIAGAKVHGKKLSVINTYPITEDCYLLIDYLNSDFDDILERLDRKIAKENSKFLLRGDIYV